MQKLCLFILLGLLAGCQQAAESDLTMIDGWLRLPPPGMAMTAGFGTLTNHGKVELRVVGAELAVATSVQIHRSRIVDGVAQMRRVEAVTLAPGETVALAPGGLHLMVMGLRDPLQVGQTLELQLIANDGQRFTAPLTVRRNQD